MGMKTATEHAKTHGERKVLLKIFLCALCVPWFCFAPTFASEDALAAAHYHAAIEAAEGMRGMLGASEQKSGLLWTKLAACEGLVEVLLKEGSESAGSAEGAGGKEKPSAPGAHSAPSERSSLDEAFTVAEKMRAPVPSWTKSAPPDLREKVSRRS